MPWRQGSSVQFMSTQEASFSEGLFSVSHGPVCAKCFDHGWCRGSSPLWMIPPRQAVPGADQGEQASNLHSSTAAASAPTSRLLLCRPSSMNCALEV